MIYLIIAIMGIIVIFRVFFGTFQSITFMLFHPLRFFKCTIGDLVAWCRNLKKKEIPESYSGIVLIGGLFGTGKTANQVAYAAELFNSYRNVDIYSNVTLNGIKYTHFDYLEQLLEPCPEGRFRVFLCDEFGSLFNSRNYKDCKLTEGEYLTMLNQVRKERKLLIVTTQRYHMLDKVFRQVAKEWWECSKHWRFLLVRRYDPLEMELNSSEVRPLSIVPDVRFLDEQITSLYDTHEIVHTFKRNVEIVDKSENTAIPVKFDNSVFKRKNKEK